MKTRHGLVALVAVLAWGGLATPQEGGAPSPAAATLETALAEAVENGGFRAQLRAMDRALASYGAMTPPAAVPALLAALGKGAIPLVRADAARALGEVREVPPDMLARLTEARADASIQGEVEDALVRLERRAALGSAATGIKGETDALRIASARRILDAYPERDDLFPLLRSALSNRNPDVYANAVEGLWEFAYRGGWGKRNAFDRAQVGKALANRKLNQLPAERDRVMTAALSAATGDSGQEARSYLLNVGLTAKEPLLCRTAIQAVGFLGRSNGAFYLLPLLSDPEPRIRLEALRAFRKTARNSGCGREILHFLQKCPEPSLPDYLVALTEAGPEALTVAPHLVRQAYRYPPALLMEVVESLGVDGRAAPLIGELLKVPPGTALEETESRLVSLGAPAVPLLVWVLDARDRETRLRTASVLGRMGPGARGAVLELQRRLEDWDPPVEKAYGDAIRAITGAEPLQDPSTSAEPFFSGRTGSLLDLTTASRKEGGGGTAGAVDAALGWLARHQSSTGSWDCDGFEKECKGDACGGAGNGAFDTGVTGLALLAFLGAGETHRGTKYGEVVRKGFRHLASIQDSGGCFGSRKVQRFTYNHAMATLAFAEACGMTGSSLYRRQAQWGVEFIEACQNPYLAWRYGLRPQDNDTSMTAWMVMALNAARHARLEVDPVGFDGAKAWLDKVTEPEYGRSGYTARGNGPDRPSEMVVGFPADKSEADTAFAIMTRIWCGASPEDVFLSKGRELCARCPPVWDAEAGTIDFCYWHFGSLALFQVGGKDWGVWNAALKKALLDSQNLDSAAGRFGSWDPEDPWGREGGRVYSTAINCLTLETYYRYPRVLKVK